MYCNKCGAEINDEAVICPKCGCETRAKNEQQKDSNVEKTGLGALMGVFLGIIGLIVGLCMFPADTVSRKSFIKGWGIAFGITAGVGALIYFIIAVTLN